MIHMVLYAMKMSIRMFYLINHLINQCIVKMKDHHSSQNKKMIKKWGRKRALLRLN